MSFYLNQKTVCKPIPSNEIKFFLFFRDQTTVHSKVIFIFLLNPVFNSFVFSFYKIFNRQSIYDEQVLWMMEKNVCLSTRSKLIEKKCLSGSKVKQFFLSLWCGSVTLLIKIEFVEGEKWRPRQTKLRDCLTGWRSGKRNKGKGTRGISSSDVNTRNVPLN